LAFESDVMFVTLGFEPLSAPELVLVPVPTLVLVFDSIVVPIESEPFPAPGLVLVLISMLVLAFDTIRFAG
jgi:hypothetical protein